MQVDHNLNGLYQLNHIPKWNILSKNIDGPDGTKWKEVGCVIWKVKKLKGLSNSRKTEQYGQKDSYQFKFKIKCKFKIHDTDQFGLISR